MSILQTIYLHESKVEMYKTKFSKNPLFETVITAAAVNKNSLFF